MKPLRVLLLLTATASPAAAIEAQSVQKRDTTEFGVHDRPWADDMLTPSEEAEKTPADFTCSAGLQEAIRRIEASIEPIERGEGLPSMVRHSYIEAAASLAIVAEERKELERRRMALADSEALTAAAALRVSEEIDRLKALKAEIAEMIESLEKKEDANIERVTAVYQGMQAKDAARLLAAGDRMAAVDILGAMSERDAGALIARMDEESADDIMRLLSERGRLAAGGAEPANEGW